MSRVVISDASPVRYLVLIGHADVLAGLYTDVLIPEAVAMELRQPATPEPVRRWIAEAPSWLQIISLANPPAPFLSRISIEVNARPSSWRSSSKRIWS